MEMTFEKMPYLEAEGFVRAEEEDHEDGGEIVYYQIAASWLPDEEFLREPQP